MARVDSLNNFLTDVANSIRTKKGTTDAILASDFDAEIESIETDPNLQNKSITITENGTQNVTADEGYDGLSDVEVITNVPTGGDIPTKGFIINEWDSNGYPTEITLIGFTDGLPNSLFENYNTSYKNMLTKNLLNVILPNNLTKISQYCFRNCNTLINVHIPDTVTIIDYYSFNSCTKLALTELPKNLTTIADYAFMGCNNLALKNLPSGLTSIGDTVFRDCTNLALTSLPNGLTSIGPSAFYNCTNLALTELPSTLTSISSSAFYRCTNLALTELPSGLKGSLGVKTFYGCSNITIKTIPDGITKVTCFAECKSLTQMSMPNITSTDSTGGNSMDYAFTNCINLKAVWIGSSITSSGFGRFTFIGCTNLAKIFIDLPRATVETFTNYQYAFMNDTSKTGIIICNDDEGFMTKDEFDAIDWSTYTEEV